MDNEESPKVGGIKFGKRADLPPYESTMDVLSEDLRAYVWSMERFLEEKRTDAQKLYDETEGSSWFAEDLSLMSELFPNLLRSSFFLSAYSLIDDGLEKRCQCIKKAKKARVSLEDIRGQGNARKYMEYLEKLGEVDSKRINDWETIGKYISELRNRVAHNRGRLKLTNEELMKFVRSKPHWFGLKGDKIIFKKGFCEELVEIIRRFFSSLDTQLPPDCQDLDDF